MSRARIRILLVVALVATNFLILVGPLHAQGNMVTGTVVLLEKVSLSRNAVAVVTLTDRSKDGAGTIIGQQRIDGVTGSTRSLSNSTPRSSTRSMPIRSTPPSSTAASSGRTPHLSRRSPAGRWMD